MGVQFNSVVVFRQSVLVPLDMKWLGFRPLTTVGRRLGDRNEAPHIHITLVFFG